MKKINKFKKILTNIIIYIINIFLNKTNLIKPKVSIFLPIYNKESFIKRSILSIQKQTLKNIEIIAVNDFSTDNSLKILKEMVKKDKRIKIVNNDRNHGLLYSRAMGILNSTGEFVMNLDPDDQIAEDNNLEILYNKSKELKLDIITFLLIKMNTRNKKYLNILFRKLKNNHFKSFKKYPKYEYPIMTNKFIKMSIIIKAFKFFKRKIYSNKWNYHEDNIWNILVNKYAKSKIYLNQYIYLYFLNRESLMKNRRNLIELKNYIYRFEMYEIIYENKHNIILKHHYKLFHIINKYFYNVKKDIEIKNKIIHLFIKYYPYNKLNNINSDLKKKLI